MTASEGVDGLFLCGIAHPFLLAKAKKQKKDRRDPKVPPAEGGEILHYRARYEARQPYPAVRLSGAVRGEGGRLDQARDLLLDVLGDGGRSGLQTLGTLGDVAVADIAGSGRDRGLDAAAVPLGDVRRLTDLTLDAGAGALDLTLEAVAGGGAATLELA